MAQYDKYDSAELGRLGSLYVADTNDHAGAFGRIYAITACTFTTLTGNCTGGVAMTLAAGQSLWGYFTLVKLAAGTAILYNAD